MLSTRPFRRSVCILTYDLDLLSGDAGLSTSIFPLRGDDIVTVLEQSGNLTAAKVEDEKKRLARVCCTLFGLLVNNHSFAQL